MKPPVGHIKTFAVISFLWAVMLLSFCFLCPDNLAFAQQAKDTAVAETDTSQEEALEAEITRLKTMAETYTELETSAKEGLIERSLDAVQGRLAAVNKLIATLQQRQSLLQEHRNLKVQLHELEETAKESVQLDAPPPYSLAYLDQSIDLMKAKRLDLEAENTTLKAAKERAALERKAIDDAKTNLNRSNERLRTAGQDDHDAVAFEQDTAKLLLDLAQERLTTAAVEVERIESNISFCELELRIASKKMELIRKQTLFREQELNEILERQKQAVAGLDKELEKAREETEQHKKKLEDAEKNSGNELDPESKNKAKKNQHLIKMRIEASEAKIVILESLKKIEDGIEKLWQLRFDMHNSGHEASQDWERILSLLREQMDLFSKDMNASEQRANSLRGQVTALENNLRDWSGQDGEKRYIEDQLNILSERLLLRNRIQMRMNQAKALAERFIEETRSRQSSRPFKDILADYGRKAFTVVSLAFDREILEIGDESITGRKLFYMALILILGILLSRLLTRYIKNYALKRLKLRSNMVFVIAKLTNYVTFLIVVYLALNYVNIPLTIFAFMGGAVALGLGFGAQNLINNFLSGLILMGEQPIRLGDVVEIEGKMGTVTNIGTRASRLRMPTGYDILIPNSKILETSVINWTLTDSKVRRQVDVCVSYDAPAQEVSRLLLQAVMEQRNVLLDPEPAVFFEAFGDNGLEFTIYFWMEMKASVDIRKTLSDIRFRTATLFAENGVLFAYPQRDIHLDSINPVEIRLLQDRAQRHSDD